MKSNMKKVTSLILTTQQRQFSGGGISAARFSGVTAPWAWKYCGVTLKNTGRKVEIRGNSQSIILKSCLVIYVDGLFKC